MTTKPQKFQLPLDTTTAKTPACHPTQANLLKAMLLRAFAAQNFLAQSIPAQDHTEKSLM